jgi:hypothetical protein
MNEPTTAKDDDVRVAPCVTTTIIDDLLDRSIVLYVC